MCLQFRVSCSVKTISTFPLYRKTTKKRQCYVAALVREERQRRQHRCAFDFDFRFEAVIISYAHLPCSALDWMLPPGKWIRAFLSLPLETHAAPAAAKSQDHDEEEEVSVRPTRRDGEYVSQRLTESRRGEITPTATATATATTTTARGDEFSLATAAAALEATETAFLASSPPPPLPLRPRRSPTANGAEAGAERARDEGGRATTSAHVVGRLLPFRGRFSCRH